MFVQVANMKLVQVLLVAALCALAGSSEVPIAKIQKDVLLLLAHINQPPVYPQWTKTIESYNVSQHESDYTDLGVVHQFELYESYGFLPKGEVFSVTYQPHLNQSIILFELFYYAKTYEVFYNTAVWARYYFNEGMFLYAYSLAVVHRPDMKEVILPPIYEIYPYYFYNVEVIQKAYKLKQMHNPQNPVSTYDQNYGYTIYANYSGYYLNLHPEQSLSYYLEDVGINAFYYYYNLYYPFWMSSKEYGFTAVNRGEQYFFLYQQLLAKYYMERLSNGFGEIPFFNWELPIETPYYPSLEYPNGLEFPSRPPFVKLQEYYYNYGQTWSWKSNYGYSYTLIKDWERRISDAIDYGVLDVHGQKINLYNADALNILGNLIEGNPDSPNADFYGTLSLYARHLLGYSYQPLDLYQIAPSALEHFETSLRDPVFYQLYKKILLLFYRYFYKLPFYSYKELVFSGVDITNVEFDKLVTYDDHFYSDISNVVYDTNDELLQDSFHIRVAQSRLNHKPYNYKVTVNSEKPVQSVVKIFLAPIYDEYNRYINISHNFMNMVLLDYFVYDLKAGENVISRNSYDTQLYGKDPLSYHEIYQQMLSAEGGKGSWSPDQYYWYLPHRYMLPQGTTSGMPFQFYVVVYPYVPEKTEKVTTSTGFDSFFYPIVNGHQFIDSYPLLYPFDKPIIYEKLWHDIPNFYSYETKIYHVEDVNVVH